MIKMLALDLDDTLLTTDKKVSEGNRAALQACLDQGIRVVTASGRFNESQLVFIRMLELGLENQLHLGDGGGTIFNESGIVKTMGTFDPDTYQAILAQTRELEIPCFVTNGVNVYYDIEEQPLMSVYRLVTNARRKYIHYISDLCDVVDPMRFVFCFNNPSEYERICRIQQSGTINYSAGRNLREISMNSLDKLQGLAQLAKMYDVGLDEIASFGDSENDIPMLKGTGLGLAVANASERVKEVADFTGLKSNDDDGVAWLIERYIL